MLLALAGYRLTRLVGWDVVTRPVRERATRRKETGSGKTARDTSKGRKLPGYRKHLDTLIHCPFCQGWWTVLALWGCWSVFPHWTLVAASPFALSAVVGLVTKTLDR